MNFKLKQTIVLYVLLNGGVVVIAGRRREAVLQVSRDED
jgi:hypothetical protein